VAAADRALALPRVAGARAVLAYGATPEELDPEPLLARLRERGARVALPRVSGMRDLDLHWIDGPHQCEAGSFGILEPTPDCARAALDQIDLVLVPGVAFDRDGNRLGYGGGFYDALLAALRPGVRTVGLAFDEQVFETIPAEEHDWRVDTVVTPSAVYPIEPGSFGR
jgi:5-formyltetrahydrofolate cyclo-ligase